MTYKEELLQLLKKDAYKKGDYTLSSGRKSEHYVNCKPVTLSSRGLTLCSIMLLGAVEKDAVAVAGLTLGADPLVSGVSVVCGLSHSLNLVVIFFVFSKNKFVISVAFIDDGNHFPSSRQNVCIVFSSKKSTKSSLK